MVSFGKPTIGPRAYLALGPSNWFETFPRKEADEALSRLLGEMPLSLVVESILRQQTLAKKPVDWSCIVEHVEKLLGGSRDAFEPRAIIALWANILVEQEKLKTKKP
jgi:hypothetical protein